MRPLALLVVAEFVVILLLAALWLGGTPTDGEPRAARPPAPSASTPAPDPASSTIAPPTPTPIERSEAPPTVAEVEGGDAVGILVCGKVLDASGAPIAAAGVSMRRNREYRSGDSVAPGVYAIAGLHPGEWQITCRAEGFANYEATCTLDARAFQQIDIELRPSYLVRVKVQGADGKPIAAELQKVVMFGLPYVVATEQPLTGDLPITENSRISRLGISEWTELNERGSQTNKTEAELLAQGYSGVLRLDQPPPLYAALLLRNTLLQTQRIEAGQHELVFTIEASDVLAKFGTVRLRLVDGVTGAPIEGGVVRLSTAQGGGSHSRTGADGRATIERVLPGLASLQLIGIKDRESIWRYVRVPSGSTIDLGDITPSAAIKISGSVLTPDGKPANGASVQWTELDARAAGDPLATRRSTPVDADGRFELSGCGRRRYVVSAHMGDGSWGFTTVDASGGAPADVAITLAAPTTITLHAKFDVTVGYTVSVLAGDRSPVAVAVLGSQFRPKSVQLPPGSYTIEIHDMKSNLLVRTMPLTVGNEPLTIDVP